MKKALIVVTSIAKYDELSRPTGLWFGEVVHFADVLLKNGYEIDYVSPQGGYTPIDPESLKKDIMTKLDWEYYQDKSFMNQLGKTLTPADINSENYQVIYYAGGHGVIWDFKENDSLQKITEDIYSKDGIVSSVCHGVIGLLNIKDNNNEFLIKDKNITGFSNSEEIEAGLDTHVPYLPEDEIKKRGANYIQEKNWTSFAVSDGRIVTGQNPQSGKAVAEEVLKVIKN